MPRHDSWEESDAQHLGLLARWHGHRSLAEHLLTLSRDPVICEKASMLCEDAADAHKAMPGGPLGPPTLANLIRARLAAADSPKDAVVMDFCTLPELGERQPLMAGRSRADPVAA